MKRAALLALLLFASVQAAKAARAMVERTRANIAAVMAGEVARHG